MIRQIQYKHKYVALWKRIFNPQQEDKLTLNKSIQLLRSDFEKVGNRKSYRFNLELHDGICINNIGGSAVARDLYFVMNQYEFLKKAFVKGHYKINMNKDFILKITKLS